MNEISSSNLDSELIEMEPEPSDECHSTHLESQVDQEVLLATFQDFLRSDEFKKKLEESIQLVVWETVPQIAEKLIKEEIKRLTE